MAAASSAADDFAAASAARAEEFGTPVTLRKAAVGGVSDPATGTVVGGTPGGDYPLPPCQILQPTDAIVNGQTVVYAAVVLLPTPYLPAGVAPPNDRDSFLIAGTPVPVSGVRGKYHDGAVYEWRCTLRGPVPNAV